MKKNADKRPIIAAPDERIVKFECIASIGEEDGERAWLWETLLQQFADCLADVEYNPLNALMWDGEI